MGNLPLKQHITDLVLLLKKQGVTHVVICPGSRNAPLIQVFQREEHFACHSIVDERSAGYVALGMAVESQRPVVVLTTSGTAVLNLAPAVAEAFNQGVPLVVLTADRPEEFPSQFTNQRIRQQRVFEANSGGFFELLPEYDDPGHLASEMEKVAVLIREKCIGARLPVHLNIILHEPLYDEITREHLFDADLEPLSSNVDHSSGKSKLVHISLKERNIIEDHISTGKKILVIAGMSPWAGHAGEIVDKLVNRSQVAVIAENISNVRSNHVITAPELALSANSTVEHALKPDLVITMGGPVVSKKTRLFVQALKNIPVIAMKGSLITCLEHLDKIFPKEKSLNNHYITIWKKLEKDASEKAESYFRKAPFSNISAVYTILHTIPSRTTVHLGNSGTVRYSQLFSARHDLLYRSNRGTSGIDGSLSTAVGAAMVSAHRHVVITGDLSFMYDSNALWNRNFPSNLSVIVINDHGGGIFRLLDGPDRMPFFSEFSVTQHPVQLEQIVQAHGLNFLRVKNDNTMKASLDAIFSGDPIASVMEVDTSESENSGIFKNFYKSIH